MINNHKVNLIVCLGPNGLIGDKKPKKGTNGLLWHIPEELAVFKEITSNNILVFGANTAKYVPLKTMKKTREIIVLDGSNSLYTEIEKINSDKEIFICGGYSIYKWAIEEGIIDKMYISFLKPDKVKIETPKEPLYLTINLDGFHGELYRAHEKFTTMEWVKKYDKDRIGNFILCCYYGYFMVFI